MKTILDSNPLNDLYEYMNDIICNKDYKYDEKSDELLDYILSSNNYIFNIGYKTKTIELYSGFYIYFIKGCYHTDLRSYDYINIYNTSYLIIPIDQYLNINNKDYDKILGHSVQFNSIKNIIEFFISVTCGNINKYINTIQADIINLAPSIIAACIINNKCGLLEIDVDGNNIDYNYLMNIIYNEGLMKALMGFY